MIGIEQQTTFRKSQPERSEWNGDKWSNVCSDRELTPQWKYSEMVTKRVVFKDDSKRQFVSVHKPSVTLRYVHTT